MRPTRAKATRLHTCFESLFVSKDPTTEISEHSTMGLDPFNRVVIASVYTAATAGKVSNPSTAKTRARKFLAWLAILGVVAFIVYRNTRSETSIDEGPLRTATERFRMLIL